MQSKKFEVTHSDEEWRRILTPEQYRVMREHGTEPPGSCALNTGKQPGVFLCAGCGQRLFVSRSKFESGTGWPSFFDRSNRSPGAWAMARASCGASSCSHPRKSRTRIDLRAGRARRRLDPHQAQRVVGFERLRSGGRAKREQGRERGTAASR